MATALTVNQSHDDQQVPDVQTIGGWIETGVDRLRFADEHFANRWAIPPSKLYYTF